MKQTKKQIIKQADKLLTASAKKIAKLENPNTKIAIFGAGNATLQTSRNFDKEHITPICYIDNDEKKWGGGIPKL